MTLALTSLDDGMLLISTAHYKYDILCRTLIPNALVSSVVITMVLSVANANAMVASA